MSKYILTICIGTYNRRNNLIPDVKSYLSLNDNRFCIRVQDNCSTDGTWEELQEIKDPRLITRQNKTNIGGLPNHFAALTENYQSDYVLTIIDKDLINISLLTKFLDILIENAPYFGYVRLDNNQELTISQFKKGEDALRHMAYRCNHPSGIFWKREILDAEMKKKYYFDMDLFFDFRFDVINAHFAQYYSGIIVDMPLIKLANKRPEVILTRTLSYNEDNIYFGTTKKIETFMICLNDLRNLDIDMKIKRVITLSLFRSFSGQVSVVYRHIMQQKSCCNYYNIKERIVPYSEMKYNISLARKIYFDFSSDYLWRSKAFCIYYGRLAQALLITIKEAFFKPKQTDFLI